MKGVIARVIYRHAVKKHIVIGNTQCPPKAS